MMGEASEPMKYSFSPTPDDQGAALACGDHPVGLVLVDDGEGVGADDVAQCERHGLLEGDAVGVHDVLYQLDDHLGVGLAHEVVAEPGELGAQGEVVLDDAVVDDGEAVVLGAVWVGVDVAGLAVGGPAGVCYADAAADVLAGGEVLEVIDLAAGLVDRELGVVVDQGDARAVIASVFEPLEALDQYGIA